MKHLFWLRVGVEVLLLAYAPWTTPTGAARVQGVAEPCDEYDPSGPAKSARITLSSTDFTDDSRDELRSFIVTGSIGKVDVEIVSESPRDAIRAVSALPEISGFSPYYGEKLKGIGVVVRLAGSARPARVVLELRQVCARHFRNTFLYY